MGRPRTGRVVGYADCYQCGKPVTVCENKAGQLYYFCDHCNHPASNKRDEGSVLMAKKVKKWVSTEDRQKWLGLQPGERAKPEDGDKPEVTKPWYERDIL